MRRKIEWYQEVLALEPGSRIFFALAKLFVEGGQLDDAEKTLRQGLDRHPDVMEARLLLVQVLTRKECIEEAQEQTRILVKALENYPAFWTLWAQQASDKDRDFAVFLMLVASHFTDKPVKWTDVVIEGLHSLTDRLLGPLKAASARRAREVTPENAVSLGTSLAASVRAQAASLHVQEPSMGIEADCSPCSPSVTVVPSSEPFVAPILHADPLPTAPSATDFGKPIPTPVSAVPEVAAKRVTAPTVLASESLTSSDNAEAPYEGPAPDAGSFRTRTMAELLASQGDFGGALGIYRDLWGHALDEQEKAELSGRIKCLENGLAAAPQSDDAPKIDPHDDPFGKHAKNRLMSTLEALAARLESRIQA